MMIIISLCLCFFSSIAAQSSLLGISRKHSSVPHPIVVSWGPRHSYKSYIQNKFARDIVVRSELVAAGSPEDGYSLSSKLENPIWSDP